MTASPVAAEAAASPPPLIGPDDPPPYTLVNPEGRAGVLLLADHAGNAIPAGLDRLGLGDEALGRHVAYDIGIAWMARRLSERLDAPALLSSYSRLLIDCNRALDDPTSICTLSDGVVVPGNRDLPPEEAARRVEAFHRPYHRAIETEIGRFLHRGIAPAVISLHSFTPILRSHPRPWHVGVLYAEDDRIARPLLAMLAADSALCVGDNQPYSGRDRHGYSIETHALPRGLANVLLEIRQDLIDTQPAAEAWADRLADPLEAILADESLYQPMVP